MIHNACYAQPEGSKKKWKKEKTAETETGYLSIKCYSLPAAMQKPKAEEKKLRPVF